MYSRQPLFLFFFVAGFFTPTLTSSVTTTSVTVSWTQPPFSFTPVGYTVTLTRVTGSGQVLCDEIVDSRSPVNTTATSMEFTGLQEFSVYIITVTATYSEFNLIASMPANIRFITLRAGVLKI